MPQKLLLVFKILGVFVALGLGAVLLTPNLREKVQDSFNKKQRVILAVAAAKLDESGDDYQILKVKTKDGLFIEVYGAGNAFLSSAKLPDSKDGYFTFNGQVTNLAIDDINNDQFKEILATSFDDNMVARLNVYRFVKGQKNLEPIELN